MLQRLDWLLASPWRVVALVALLIGVPVIALGELSANDTRGRLRAEELRATADTAQRGADLVSAQVNAVRDQVVGAVGNIDLKVATDESNEKELAVLVRDFKSVMSRDVRRLFVVDPLFGRVLAVEPFDEKVVGQSVVDKDYFTQVARTITGRRYYVSPAYEIADVRPGAVKPPGFVVSAPIQQRGLVGVLVAEVDLGFMHFWLLPLLASAEDVYVLDDQRRLIGRAIGLGTAVFRDLSGDPTVREMLASSSDHREASDPLGRGRRLLATAPVGEVGWAVMVVRSGDVAGREVGTALGQLALFRYLLVALLLVGAYFMARNASELVRQRRALAEANAQLVRASQAKSQFLASMSHELRTPMNAILGFTDALLAGVDGPLNDEQRASLTWVQRGGRDLLLLINEVLDLSRIEAGKLAVSPESLEPRELVEAVVAQQRPLAEEKGLRFTWRDEGLPGQVVLDRQRTRQILVNLCGNALKFTKEGEVEVVGSGASEGGLLVTVRDTGPGIPHDQLEAIFEEFRQAEGTTAQGTGLGLAISRRLARLMGGDITVESQVGRGSTFRLTLPLDCRAPALLSAAAPGRERLLLAVDDDPSVAPLLEKMLADRGYHVAGVTNGSLAVAEARRLRPSVITLDILMPGRDGRDVLNELRGDPATKEIPVIVLSVVDKGDVPQGADGHLSKPLRKDRLLRALDEIERLGLVHA